MNLQPDISEQAEDFLEIAGKRYRSRLIIGTGKYKDFAQNAAALEASGAEIVTVAVRRVNVTDPNQPMLVDYIDPKKYTYLPNTAGCFTADDAVRTLRLAREAGGWELVKLEVLGDQQTLYPNMLETLIAARKLLDEGFQVMVYCNDDPILAKELEDMGCCAIMPLAAPIGSGLGVQNPVMIRLIVEQSKVPVIVGSQKSGENGQGDEACGRGRTFGLSCRPDAEEKICRSVLAARGSDLIGLTRLFYETQKRFFAGPPPYNLLANEKTRGAVNKK